MRPASTDSSGTRRLIAAVDVRAAAASGRGVLQVRTDSIVTPEARDVAARLRVRLVPAGDHVVAEPGEDPPASLVDDLVRRVEALVGDTPVDRGAIHELVVAELKRTTSAGTH